MLRIYYWAQFLLASGLFVAWPTSCCSFITEPSYYWPQAYLWLGPHHVIMLRIYDWAQLLLASGLFVAWPTSCYYVAPTYIMSTFIWVVNLISRGVTTVSPNMAAYICWNVHIKHSVHSQRSDIWPSLSIVTVNNNNALIAESVKASVKTKILASPVSLAQLLMLSDKSKTLASPIGMAKWYHREFFEQTSLISM